MGRKPVRIARFLTHELPPFLDQKLQRPRFRGVGIQPAELVAVKHQDVQQEPGVAAIVLGSRRSKALAVVDQNGGVNRENGQLLVFSQHEHQCPPRLFEGHRDPLPTES